MNIYVEIFGYIGTALVLVSMMMSSLKKLRIINTAGSVITTVYSIIVSAYPVAFLNLGIIIINSVRLIKEGRKEKQNEAYN